VGSEMFIIDSYDEEGESAALSIENAGILQKPFFISSLKDKVMAIRHGGAAGQQDTEWRSLAGMYFLAAEDNEINAEILREILSIEQAECEIVENGKLAVERFANSEEGRFDAILMDVQMPVMNGYEATRAIRALERKDAAAIPIIAMTANAFVEDEKEALRAGMNVHLAKPINVTLLKQIIQQYVREYSKM
ncbi:MAG: response regulator, partial [Lachnospiraceae bacterium]|nr:response regulator [Lachnospiraceae bacterium]